MTIVCYRFKAIVVVFVVDIVIIIIITSCLVLLAENMNGRRDIYASQICEKPLIVSLNLTYKLMRII